MSVFGGKKRKAQDAPYVAIDVGIRREEEESATGRTAEREDEQECPRGTQVFGKVPHERDEEQEAGGVESHGCGDVPADRPEGRQQHHVRKPEKAEENEGSQWGCPIVC